MCNFSKVLTHPVAAPMPGTSSSSTSAAHSSSHQLPHHVSPAAGAASAVAPGSSSASMWHKLQQLPAEVSRQLQSIYSDHFPLEVRHALAGWLEMTFTEDLEAGNPHHEEHARSLVVSMVSQLEARAAETGDFLLRGKLEQVVDSFKVRKKTHDSSMSHLASPQSGWK